MADNEHEFSGKTVEDAINDGLRSLGLRRNQVEIETISKGSRGIFGIGSEPARVRITPLSHPTTEEAPSSVPADDGGTANVVTEPETAEVDDAVAMTASSDPVDSTAQTPTAAEEPESPPPATIEEDSTVKSVSDEELSTLAADLLSELISLMGFQADVSISWQMPDEGDGDRYLLLDITGSDLGALIGRRGETLNSIQYLIRLMINQRLRQWKNIVVDVEKYKERRVTQLTQLAQRMATQVAESGRAVSLEPMPPNERRIVHLALRDHPEVYTQSSGEGDRRKVHIVTRDP